MDFAMIETRTINTIRVLSADMVQQAASGHPGLPLGAAPAAYSLFAGHMRHTGKNDGWLNRDRFVLSAGHGSALLYSLLHLFGYDLSMDDLKAFRQLGSKTPGHPETGITPGVDFSTGPLGQGIAGGVGMALAESYMAAVFNRDGYNIVDHHTYVLCGDGCLMQGISYEAASLAGTLGLGKLILLYDSNDISIEGDISTAFSENVAARFEALGWHTQLVRDGNDTAAINKAIENAKAVTDKPSLVEIKTVIGFGSPNKAGKASAHGEPLGEAELRLTKENLGFDPDGFFVVPPEVVSHMSDLQKKLASYEEEWNELLERYKHQFPELYAEFVSWNDGTLPDLVNDAEFWTFDGKYAGDIETRTASEKIINHLSGIMKNLIGGSADLGPSNKTVMKNRGYYSKSTPDGSNIHFGAREFSMTAIANGMCAHGGLRPFIGEFFVFSDYMKPALRMAALMGLPLISVLTHDSIGVGEDGPTHQPVEQLAALRSIPNLTVIRPSDSMETACAWHLALTRKNSPTALVLTRQKVKQTGYTSKAALKGGYVLIESEKPVPDIILIATGSQVYITCEAAKLLKEKDIDARVVSLPSWRVFEEQDDSYKESVLPKAVRKRLAVEAASPFGWGAYVGLDGDVAGISTFGQAGKADALFAEYGFTVENIVGRALEVMGWTNA